MRAVKDDTETFNKYNVKTSIEVPDGFSDAFFSRDKGSYIFHNNANIRVDTDFHLPTVKSFEDIALWAFAYESQVKFLPTLDDISSCQIYSNPQELILQSPSDKNTVESFIGLTVILHLKEREHEYLETYVQITTTPRARFKYSILTDLTSEVNLEEDLTYLEQNLKEVGTQASNEKYLYLIKDGTTDEYLIVPKKFTNVIKLILSKGKTISDKSFSNLAEIINPYYSKS